MTKQAIRISIIASIRSALLSNFALVTALKHTNMVNKIVADQLNFDSPMPFITIHVTRGALENNDPVETFDNLVMVKVNGQELKELYEIYSLVERELTNRTLANYGGWRFYTPIRLMDAGTYDSFKLGQQDFYSIGCTIRVRGVEL